MQVKDLISLLMEQDPNAQVQLATDYGDITHTTQLHNIGEVSEVAQSRVHKSA